MITLHDLLLALQDGATAAEGAAEPGLAAALNAMKLSLAESASHRDDLDMWRQADLRAIYQEVP